MVLVSLGAGRQKTLLLECPSGDGILRVEDENLLIHDLYDWSKTFGGGNFLWGRG
jgi:hypothetical protein